MARRWDSERRQMNESCQKLHEWRIVWFEDYFHVYTLRVLVLIFQDLSHDIRW